MKSIASNIDLFSSLLLHTTNSTTIMNTASEIAILVFVSFVIFYVVYIPMGMILNVTSRLISRLQLLCPPCVQKQSKKTYQTYTAGHGQNNVVNVDSNADRSSKDSAHGTISCGVTVIVPAFLDNEITIIEKTLQHLLSPDRLEWDGPMQIILAYNNSQHASSSSSTSANANDGKGDFAVDPPTAIPTRITDGPTIPTGKILEEDKLRLLERLSILEESQNQNHSSIEIMRMRELECYCVAESTSKAENVNEACKRAKYEVLVIYDADNIPEFSSMTRLYKTMVDHNVDMVQGHTYQSFFDQNAGFLFKLRQILNSIQRYVSSQLMQPSLFMINFPKDWCWILTGQANVMMKRRVMEEVPYDKDFVIEDADFSLRVQTEGFKVRFCNTSQVAEQTIGSSFYDFYKIQLRYYKGMEQVYRGIRRGRYGHRFPIGLWFGIYPALQIAMVINYLVWPAMLFYHISVEPIGDSLEEWGMNVTTSKAINILMLISLYLNQGVCILLLYPLDFLSINPQYFSTWEIFEQLLAFVVTFPFMISVMFGAFTATATIQAKISIFRGEVPEFNCTPRYKKNEEHTNDTD